MNRADATSKNGLILAKNAEEPAAPAAKRNGNIGKQQLEAKTMLPSAARLAAMVRFEREFSPPFSKVSLGIVILLTLSVWR
jgi:hypothetical protein